MADKKKLSVAEILAAARKLDGGGAADEPEPVAAEVAAETGSTPAELSETAAEVPAPEVTSSTAPPKPKLKPGERPSVAEMLAMARGETKPAAAESGAKSPAKPAAMKSPAGAGTEERPASKAKPVPKPVAKPVAAAGKPVERMDTASILAAARGGTKRGPVSKAEAPELATPKPAKATKPKLPAPAMPEKPAYAVPPPVPAADQTRRFILIAALFGSFFATGMTLLMTTCTVWVLALARFMFPNILTEPPSKFTVGFPDNFAPGQVETKYKAQFGVWVVNYNYNGEPSIFALSTVCTHLGCTPNWLEAEQKFKCPCHGSGFYKDGINFEGPAPRPLERYAIRVADDGQVEIDKSRKFQEEMGQWEDPASYVPV